MRVFAAAICAVLLLLAPVRAQEAKDFAVTAPDIVRVQRALAARGFNPGPMDGRYGGRTEATLAAFQAAYGLKITGEPDEPTLKELFRPAAESAKDNPFTPGRAAVEVVAPDAVPLTPVETILLYQREQPAPAAPSTDGDGVTEATGSTARSLKGLGEEDPGLEVLRSLAEQGHASAQFNLGFFYDYGQGVEQDQVEAMGWYRLAATQGLAEAQFSIGVLYESGGGVPKNLVEAYRWYGLAADSVAPGRARDTFVAYRDRVAKELSLGDSAKFEDTPEAPEPTAPAGSSTGQATLEPAPEPAPIPTAKPPVEITVGKASDDAEETGGMAAKAAVETGGFGDSTLETLRLFDKERDTWGRQDRVLLIQQLLTDDGLYSGPIDGKMGYATRSAIGKYQRTHELRDRSEAGILNHFAARAYFLRGYVHQEAGESADAIQQYSEAIRLETRFANAHFNRGLVYYRQGDYLLAIVDFDTSLSHNPWNGPAFFNRANAYYELGYYFLAAKDYLSAVRLEIKSW